MPDGTKNFAVDTSNAPVGDTTVTRSQFVNILEHLNYAAGNIRTLDEIGSAGIPYLNGSGGGGVRTLTAQSGLSFSNGTGVGGNPTLSLNAPDTFRRSLFDWIYNDANNTKMVSIISVAGSYALPTPTAGQANVKIVINQSAGNADITSSDWGDSITQVRIPAKDMAIFVSDDVEKWYVQLSASLTIT